MVDTPETQGNIALRQHDDRMRRSAFVDGDPDSLEVFKFSKSVSACLEYFYSHGSGVICIEGDKCGVYTPDVGFTTRPSIACIA
ncbi:hypothetical protein [Prosthecomicrobium hirschii]|uniref:hypothetical protein n=1 Tax=Prosthecodimorpha hirschii TaxID=665126 RepID=UPI00128F7243|nr:hypothetical protein [Prosthecomicrobium hirschii]